MLSSENVMLHWIQKAAGHTAALRRVCLRTMQLRPHIKSCPAIPLHIHRLLSAVHMKPIQFIIWYLLNGPIPVATRFKAWVCGSYTAWMAGLNPAAGMDVWLLWSLCVVWRRSLRRADHSSKGVLPSVVRLLFRNLDREAWAQYGRQSTGGDPMRISLHFNST